MEIAELHALFVEFAKKTVHEHVFDNDKCRFCRASQMALSAAKKKKQDARVHHWEHDYTGTGCDGEKCHDCGATRWVDREEDDE